VTFFLDGPPPPTRSADKIPSKAPVAAPVTGARQAPEPSGLTGIPVAPKKPAPAVERKRRNTRMAAIRAAALRVAARQEQEIEEVAAAATAATTTATAEPEEPEDAPVEVTATPATTTPATTAAPAADKNWRGPGPYCAATWAGTSTPCRGRARKGSDFCRTHQPEETTMPARTGGTETLKNALLAAPGPVPFDDLVAIYPGQQRKACSVRLFQMAQKGLVVGSNREGWRWKGGVAPKAKKAAPAKKSPSKPVRPEPQQEVATEEAAAEHDPIDDRPRWLIDGVVRGFISRGDCVAQIKALVQ